MNQITTALTSAGVKIKPLNHRVWLWVRDHRDHTYSEIARALGVPGSNVSSALADLESRGMVGANGDVSRARNGGLYKVKRFYAIGKEFELLPKKKVTAAKEAVRAVVVHTEKSARPEQSEPKPVTPAVNVEDNMAYAEVKALYLRLHATFGAAK